MLTPHWMYARFLPIAVKQQMAMIAGGLCGVLTLVGGAGLLVRRLTNPRIRATSSTADIPDPLRSADSMYSRFNHYPVLCTAS